MLRDGWQPLEVWFSYSLSFAMTAVYVYIGLLIWETLSRESNGRAPLAWSGRLRRLARPLTLLGLVGSLVAAVSLAGWLLLRYPGPQALPRDHFERGSGADDPRRHGALHLHCPRRPSPRLNPLSLELARTSDRGRSGRSVPGRPENRVAAAARDRAARAAPARALPRIRTGGRPGAGAPPGRPGGTAPRRRQNGCGVTSPSSCSSSSVR